MIGYTSGEISYTHKDTTCDRPAGLETTAREGADGGEGEVQLTEK